MKREGRTMVNPVFQLQLLCHGFNSWYRSVSPACNSSSDFPVVDSHSGSDSRGPSLSPYFKVTDESLPIPVSCFACLHLKPGSR